MKNTTSRISRRDALKTLGGAAAVLSLGTATSVGGAEKNAPSAGRGITVHGAAPVHVDRATLFAFDDVSLPFSQNLYLQMASVQKHPENPILPRGPKDSPDAHRVQFYGSIIRHEGKFKLWYIAGDVGSVEQLAKKSFLGFRPAYAESTDGVHWVRPDLGLVEYNGNRNNNLVQVDPPNLMTMHLVVLHEPEDADPSKRFKMVLLVRTTRADGSPMDTTVPLFSADGLRWKSAVDVKMDSYVYPREGLVLPDEYFEQAGLYKWQGTYFLPGQQGRTAAWLPNGKPCGRVMAVFRSNDFVHWSGTKTIAFIRDQAHALPGNRGKQAHEGASVWNRGNVLIGLYGLFNGPRDDDGTKREGHTVDMGLLISNDGVHWREPMPDHVLIPCGPEKTWDSQSLLSGQGFENFDGRTHIWYGGISGDITSFGPVVDFGLATLQEDRFGAILVKNPAGSTPACFVTCPLQAGGPVKLSVNAEGLSTNARLRVELLNEREEPIQGYALDGAGQVTASGLHMPVAWKSKDRIRGLKDPFRIKVSFEGEQRGDIKLYALYLES